MAVTLLAAACAFVPPAHFGATLRGASRASHTPKMMIEATQGLSSDMYMDDRLTARMGFIDPMYNDAYYDGNRNAAMGEGMYGGSAYPRYGSRFARRDMYAQDAYSRRMADDFTDDYRYGGRGFDQLMRSRNRYGDMDRRERVGGYLRNRHYRYGRDGDWDRDGYYNDWDRGSMRYGSYGLSSRVDERLWTLRRETAKDGMGYADFVTFLLAEEDKQSSPALQYWFHVLDVDGDGYLDRRDMWYFYEELQSRLEAMDEELVSYDEIVNEFFDIVKPAAKGRISLAELKRCGLGYNLVSALTNVRKFLAWEALSCEKAAGRSSNLRDSTEWDLFADREYRRLVEAEEQEEAEDGDVTA